MSILRPSPRFERWLVLLAFVYVLSAPLVLWLLEAFRTHAIARRSPYVLADLNLILVVALLTLIYERVKSSAEEQMTGDESKIIMNRNQSDYYEIWEEVRAYRDVTIEAVGHSFNTLWFNFLKKFLYEVVANKVHFDSVTIHLIATVTNPSSYQDIEQYYQSLDLQAARRIRIELLVASYPVLFFTGLCVNKSALWLSIREPFTAVKANEHVREWRRKASPSAEKMVNWYLGVVDFLTSKAVSRKILATAAAAPAQAVQQQVSP